MNKNILLTLIVILVLTACTPSESQIATSAAATELASPSDTPKPSFTLSPTTTLTPSTTPTETVTPTPTPDLRVVDGYPKQMVLSAEDLSAGVDYFPSNFAYMKFWQPPYSNSKLKKDYGEEKVSKYIELSGRIDGYGSVLQTNQKSPNVAEFILSEVVIFSTSAGPETEQNDIRQINSCYLSMDIRSINIGVEADGCFSKFTFLGETSQDYHIIHGIYRNILFSVTVIGPENTLSEDIVIELAKLLVSKIKTFPLVDEVTYTAY